MQAHASDAQTLELQKSLDLLSAYGEYRNFLKVNKGFIKAHGLGKKIQQIRSSKAAAPDAPASPSRQPKMKREERLLVQIATNK